MEKKQEHQEKCDLVLCAQDTDDKWYIDNGCSHHMERDKKKNSLTKRGKGWQFYSCK